MTDLELATAPLFIALEGAIQRCLESPAYRNLPATLRWQDAILEKPAGADASSLPRRQARMIAGALCDSEQDELQAFPAFARLRRLIEIERRNARIVAAFTGHNYSDLSARWGLSTRQIRRIVGEPKKIVTRIGDSCHNFPL